MEERAKSNKSKAGARRVLLHDRRVTIPKRFRDHLGLKNGSVFEVRIEGKRLVLQLIKR